MEQTGKKSRTPLLVTILVAINVLSLATIWYLYFYSDRSDMQDFKYHRNRQHIEGFMKNKMDFTAEQMIKLNELRNEYFAKSRTIFDSIATLKKAVIDEIMRDIPDTAAVRQLTNRISGLTAVNEYAFAMHFIRIKGMCNPDQKMKLRSLLDGMCWQRQGQCGPMGHDRGMDRNMHHPCPQTPQTGN